MIFRQLLLNTSFILLSIDEDSLRSNSIEYEILLSKQNEINECSFSNW